MGQHRADAQYRYHPTEWTIRLSAHLAAWFASGHAADLVLLVMVIEVVALARFTRLRPIAIVAATVPGALIVIALRAALVGAAWPWIALPLLLAWPAHLWDMKLRTRAPPR